MQYFLTGATGYLGSRVAERLSAQGHQVHGLARNATAATRLRQAGMVAHAGNLAEPESMTSLLENMDGVILMAFDHTADWSTAVAQERHAAAVFSQALAGTGKLLIATTATGVLGDTGANPVDDSFPGQPDFPARDRMAVEQDVLAAAALGVRSVIIRPPILLHGHGKSMFVPLLLASARTTGVVGHIGGGQNHLACAHVDDVADLYVLAAAGAHPGSLFNAAGAEVSTAALATAIRDVAAPTTTVEALTPARATELWGGLAVLLMSINNRPTGNVARSELGWKPYVNTPAILQDIARGSYQGAGQS